MTYILITTISSILFMLLVLPKPLISYFRNVVTVWATTPVWDQDTDSLKKAGEYHALIGWYMLYMVVFLVSLPTTGVLISKIAPGNLWEAIALVSVSLICHATILFGLLNNVRGLIQQQSRHVASARASIARGIQTVWEVSQQSFTTVSEQKSVSAPLINNGISTALSTTTQRFPLGFTRNELSEHYFTKM